MTGGEEPPPKTCLSPNAYRRSSKRRLTVTFSDATAIESRFPSCHPCSLSLVRRRADLPLAALIMVLATMDGSTADWPEFRGPTGQGHATAVRIPADLDPAASPVWKIPVPGKGWSSPVVVGHRVFLTTAVPDADEAPTRQSLRVLCFDAATGAALWNKEAFSKSLAAGAKLHAKNSFASPTPISDGERLFVHFGPDGTAAFDFDGSILWTTTDLTYDPQHGAGGSPILSGDLLVFHGDGSDDPFIAAIDRATGTLVWKTSRPEMPAPRWSFCTPLEIEVDGTRQLVSPASHMACSYDPATGTERWRVRYPNKWSVVPRPVFAHGLVFLCTGYDGPAELLAIRPDGEGDVTESHIAWRTDEQVPHNPSPLVIGDEIYLVSDNGIASCRDARTGALHWRKRLGGNFSASPIFVDGRILVFSEQGVCTAFAAKRTYEELSVSDFQEPILASPAVTDDGIFIRTEGHLYRFADDQAAE